MLLGWVILVEDDSLWVIYFNICDKNPKILNNLIVSGYPRHFEWVIKRENREIEGKMERELLKKTIKNEIEKSTNFVQAKSQIRKAVYESLTNNKINKQNQLSNR